jgi:hypothetical protein
VSIFTYCWETNWILRYWVEQRFFREGQSILHLSSKFSALFFHDNNSSLLVNLKHSQRPYLSSKLPDIKVCSQNIELYEFSLWISHFTKNLHGFKAKFLSKTINFGPIDQCNSHGFIKSFFTVHCLFVNFQILLSTQIQIKIKKLIYSIGNAKSNLLNSTDDHLDWKLV